MTHNKRFVERLEEGLAAALLNAPDESNVSVGTRLQEAQLELQLAVAAANKYLKDNPLGEILAEHAMRKQGKRGIASIFVDDDGHVMLEITSPLQYSKTGLPPISLLRDEALALGIDPVPFGKAKTRLMEAIAEVRGGKDPATVEPEEPEEILAPVAPEQEPEPEPPKKAKRMKVAPSITPSKVIELDDDDDLDLILGSLDDATDEPEPTVTPDPAPEIPKRSLPKRGTPIGQAAKTPTTPVKKGGRMLSAIAKNAENEVDLDALLALPTPPIPEEDDM